MTIEEQREAAARDRKRRTQRTVNAYHTIFAGPDGEAVLQDLVVSFGLKAPSMLPTATRPGESLTFCPYYTAMRSGQHSVYLHIMAKLEANVTGDANIEKGDKVLTGLSE